MQDIQTIIDALSLAPHPEGGFYKEMHRSEIAVKDLKGASNKSAYTSIYYLLSGKDFSAWHRIKSDETWYFHLGCDVLIYFFDENKLLRTLQVGMTTKNLQVTIPAHTWFAAKPLSENDFCLVSCAVAPGFEFDDFEIAGREDLSKEFGTSAENIQIIKALTRI
jgi:predicted cupin superfamily sugar epimerase